MNLRLVLITMMFFACTDAAPRPKPPVEFTSVGEVDGCKVYRFWDEGYPHYFATCPGVVTTQHQVNKSHKPDDVVTVPAQCPPSSN